MDLDSIAWRVGMGTLCHRYTTGVCRFLFQLKLLPSYSLCLEGITVLYQVLLFSIFPTFVNLDLPGGLGLTMIGPYNFKLATLVFLSCIMPLYITLCPFNARLECKYLYLKHYFFVYKIVQLNSKL